jgi:predicted MFS family arabinose efflux permease
VLLCAGTFVVGLYNAFAQYLRFAAADVADAYAPSLKERAISWVLAGGLAGGIIGPQMSKLTRELLPVTFAGTYVALAMVAVVTLVVASRLRIPHKADRAHGPARPLAQIARQPAFIVAVLAGAISYGAMNLLMTATPLAMQVCGFGYPQAADVIMWHVIAMFAPGFFTGALIRRFGLLQVMLAGCALMFATVVIAHAGLSYWHFWFALFALGIGWNFMFTGATALLTRTYTAAEKSKVQGVNDLAVFLTMITSSAASGALLSATGWTDLNLWSLPPMIVTTAAIAWLLLHTRRAAGGRRMIRRALFGTPAAPGAVRREAWLRGLRVVAPALVATGRWGLVTGVAMVKIGLTQSQALGMSLLVFAGSAQLAALPLIAADAPIWVVLLTATVVNLRFVIFSAGLYPYFRALHAGPAPAAGLSHQRRRLCDLPAALDRGARTGRSAVGAGCRRRQRRSCRHPPRLVLLGSGLPLKLGLVAAVVVGITAAMATEIALERGRHK